MTVAGLEFHRQPSEIERLLEALERSRPRLKRIMASFRLSKEDAEDLLQDLAILAIRKLAEIRSLDAWLTGVAYRLCLNRAFNQRGGPQLVSLERFDMATVPAQGRQDLAIDLERALATLPRRHREVLVLRAMGFTESEIASRTGFSSKSLRHIRIRGMTRVAAWLIGSREGKAL